MFTMSFVFSFNIGDYSTLHSKCNYIFLMLQSCCKKIQLLDIFCHNVILGFLHVFIYHTCYGIKYFYCISNYWVITMTVTIFGKNLNLGCMIMLVYPLSMQTETNSVFGPCDFCIVGLLFYLSMVNLKKFQLGSPG